KHPLVEGEVGPRLEPDDRVPLHLELDAALLAAEAAVGFDQPVGVRRRVQPLPGLVRPQRAELREQFGRGGGLSRPARRPRSVQVPRPRAGRGRASSAGTPGRRAGSARTPGLASRSDTPTPPRPESGLARGWVWRTPRGSARTGPAPPPRRRRGRT